MSEETIPQMREQIDSQEADLSKARIEIKDLTKANRTLTARDVAREQGYEAKSGELFANANPDADITAEALDTFVTDYGLGSAGTDADEGDEGSSDEGDPVTPAPGSADLADMDRSGSRPGDSAGGATTELMSVTEWQDLYAKDPAAAKEAHRQGKVRISSDNPWGDAQAVAPGVNPYAPTA
jgi:hypothetical protein